MVKSIYNELKNNLYLEDSIVNVSDGLCNYSEKKCINFDLFPDFCLKLCKSSQNKPATVDALIINITENHLLFVEFKDLRKVSYPRRWLTKEKLQNIYLKVHESLHMLSTYLNKKNIVTYNKFYDCKKSLIIVYEINNNIEAQKRKYHRHFQGKIKRFGYLLENEMTIECSKFINLLKKDSLC